MLDKTLLKPAIILGCHKIGLGIIRSLGIAGINTIAVSHNPMDMGTASKYVIKKYSMPHPDNYPSEYISGLLNIGKYHKNSVLIPSDDATLLCVSKNITLLREYFKVTACNWDIIERCIVKKYTYEIAERIGVPCPKTLIPKSIDEIRRFVGIIGFPCLLKPTVGHSFFELYRKKMILLDNQEELESKYRNFKASSIEVMLQEFIPGDDKSGVNYNSFCINGKKIFEVTAQKERLSPPKTGFPRVVFNKRIKELEIPACRLLKELKYNGFSCMEFKKDARDGIYKLMEINARLNLSTPLSVISGVNFPYILYKYAMTGEVPQNVTVSNEKVFWIDPGKDIIESIRNHKEEGLTLKSFLEPYLAPHAYTILSFNDLKPFIKRCTDLIREGMKRMIGKVVINNK